MKYRKALLDKDAVAIIRETAIGIQERYEIEIERMGMDNDHIHLLCGAHPKIAAGRIAQIFKSITGREIFRRKPAMKKYGYSMPQKPVPVLRERHSIKRGIFQVHVQKPAKEDVAVHGGRVFMDDLMLFRRADSFGVAGRVLPLCERMSWILRGSSARALRRDMVSGAAVAKS